MDNETQTSSDKFHNTQALIIEHLNSNPQDEDAPKKFSLWKRKLKIYLQSLEANDEEEINIQINRLGLNAYEYIDNATTYTEAITQLQRVDSKAIG